MTKTKKIAIAMIVAVCIVVGILMVPSQRGMDKTQLIRIHIIANSDSDADQSVKYVVRDVITSELTDKLQGVRDRNQAYDKLQQLQGDIVAWTDNVLIQQSKSYKSQVTLGYEFFPARMYESIVVDSGYYDALMVTLGEGNGQNWWCVVYPPLCFLGDVNDSVEYRSWLLEWWKSFWD
ncbi:MAG: stage II sporulation protein R [Clostridiales bacterium]|jgi:stage II sporulation protein R|nr:stage II sporulation protein R [Clostridiales bacterium]